VATRYWLVMPAAGSARRFGGRKQYERLGDATVLERALEPFLDDAQCLGGALVLAADDPQRDALASRWSPRLSLVEGGAERVHSVSLGLAALSSRAAPNDWILVHDAARPTLSTRDLAQLLERAQAEPHGALLATPVVDTLKRAQSPAAQGAAARCEATVSREQLWAAQTPQMFRFGLLCAALAAAIAAGRTPTDEAQAMEWQGHTALLVPSQDSNIKVTTASDLHLARAVLQARARGKESGS
jgi:2-C-methyl-D-erythritol 4-phosphate cytidylyltransferase